MLRNFVIAISTATAALALTALPPVFDTGAGYSAQAAENHNSSRSNRGQTSANPGNTGKDDKPQAAESSSKGYINGNGGNGMAKPGGSKTKRGGTKEEGVKG